MKGNVVVKRFVSTAIFFSYVIIALTVYAEGTPQQDILLQGGHVIDPANNINGVMDVAVVDGKIAAVGSNITPLEGMKVIDVSDLYISPGFIDIHVHSFVGHQSNLGADVGEVGRKNGTTTVVDAGTSGADDFEIWLINFT